MQLSTLIASAILSASVISAAPTFAVYANNTLTERSGCGTVPGTSISIPQGPTYKVGEHWPDSKVCMSMGAGSYLFSMVLGMTTLGLPSSTEQSVSFVIFNHACNILGIFAPSGKNTCGTPYTIEAPFLKYDLIVKDVDEDLGGASYTFAYAAGQYKIGTNHCGCKTISTGFPSAAEACGCAFPVNGAPEK